MCQITPSHTQQELWHFVSTWNSVFSWLTLPVYQHDSASFYSSIVTSHCMVVELFGIIIQVLCLYSKSASVPSLHHTDSCPHPQMFSLQAIFRHPMWKGAVSPTDLLHHPLLESPTKWHLYPWGPGCLSHWREHFTSHPHSRSMSGLTPDVIPTDTVGCSAERCGE